MLDVVHQCLAASDTEAGVRGVRIPQYRTWQREHTTIPHQNLAKYRNRNYKWGKVDVVNTTNPPFKQK